MTGVVAMWVQDHDMLRPGKLRTQPFVLTRLLPCPGTYTMAVTIHLVEAIEERFRRIDHTYSILAAAPSHDHSSIGDGALQRRKRRKLTVDSTEKITVITQEVGFQP